MIDELLLLSKNDIPFIEARLIVHQPTIKEISLIGEESFHLGCQFLNFSVENFNNLDKNSLSNMSDFDIFMSMINRKEKIRYKTDAMLVLTLMFPDYNIKIDNKQILFQKEDLQTSINSMNFNTFKQILSDIFCLNDVESGEKIYNPSGAYAKKIAEKFKKRKEILAKQKNIKAEKISIFSRYISILAVGEKKDMNELMNYSVFQLKDEFKRFQLKNNFDHYMKAMLAGAKDLEEVENWMDDIHP